MSNLYKLAIRLVFWRSFLSVPQVVGGLDIHKKMVVDVWRDWTDSSLNILIHFSIFWESAPLTRSLCLSPFSLSLVQWKYFSEWCLCSLSILPEPSNACHSKCYRAWDSSVQILGYLRTVREVASLSITERFSLVEKEERRVCVCVRYCVCVCLCKRVRLSSCFSFSKRGDFFVFILVLFF